jgi:hypothetical protein
MMRRLTASVFEFAAAFGLGAALSLVGQIVYAIGIKLGLSDRGFADPELTLSFAIDALVFAPIIENGIVLVAYRVLAPRLGALPATLILAVMAGLIHTAAYGPAAFAPASMSFYALTRCLAGAALLGHRPRRPYWASVALHMGWNSLVLLFSLL